MICTECGNQIIVGCGPICLVCQHTGRGAHIVLEAKPVQQPEEVQMRGLAAALDATYAAFEQPSQCKCCGFYCPPTRSPTDEFCDQCRTLEAGEADPAAVVLEAQLRIGVRNSRNTHSRTRPDMETEAKDERECQTCLGTRRYVTLPCPDCSEDGDRERD